MDQWRPLWTELTWTRRLLRRKNGPTFPNRLMKGWGYRQVSTATLLRVCVCVCVWVRLRGSRPPLSTCRLRAESMLIRPQAVLLRAPHLHKKRHTGLKRAQIHALHMNRLAPALYHYPRLTHRHDNCATEIGRLGAELVWRTWLCCGEGWRGVAGRQIKR